jgi:hypothetical protein
MAPPHGLHWQRSQKQLLPPTQLPVGTAPLQVRAAAKKAGYQESQDSLYAFFLERVRTNLHVVVCHSPIGDTFRERCRMFPGLVNCTTIDWFTRWPTDALFEVASKLLEGEDVGGPDTRTAICRLFVTAHESVTDISDKMFETLKRQNYVTPTNYLEFVGGYKTLLMEKKETLTGKAKKLHGGLTKLDETSVQVGEMQACSCAFFPVLFRQSPHRVASLASDFCSCSCAQLCTCRLHPRLRAAGCSFMQCGPHDGWPAARNSCVCARR